LREEVTITHGFLLQRKEKRWQPSVATSAKNDNEPNETIGSAEQVSLRTSTEEPRH
jgi:hypothetical protein